MFRNSIPYSGNIFLVQKLGTKFLFLELYSLFSNYIPCSGTIFLVQEPYSLFRIPICLAREQCSLLGDYIHCPLTYFLFRNYTSCSKKHIPCLGTSFLVQKLHIFLVQELYSVFRNYIPCSGTILFV